MISVTEHSPTQKTVSRRQLAALVIVVIWLLSTAMIFWWFQFRYLGQFEQNLANFKTEALSQWNLVPTKSSALVVHFVDEHCPCSRFSDDHIKELEARFQKDVSFYRWPDLPMALVNDPLQMRPPISPAVAIWNPQGQLTYFGPYSSGAFCGQGEDLVAAVLNDLLSGSNTLWSEQNAIGCFCPWH